MFSSEVAWWLRNVPSFLGCFPRDLLPMSGLREELCFIANTEFSNQNGMHWVAFYVKNGRGIYMDPYGASPYVYIEFETWLNKHCPRGWQFNRVRLQCATCVSCGPYCIVFLKCLALYKSSLESFVQIFTTNLRANDKIVLCLYKTL